MRKETNVESRRETLKGLEFDKDTIFVRDNIRRGTKECKITKEVVSIWIYDEIQYSYNEYLEVLNTKVETANSTQDDLILDNAYRVAMLELNSPAQATI